MRLRVLRQTSGALRRDGGSAGGFDASDDTEKRGGARACAALRRGRLATLTACDSVAANRGQNQGTFFLAARRGFFAAMIWLEPKRRLPRFCGKVFADLPRTGKVG
jgi:hypothetical protein